MAIEANRKRCKGLRTSKSRTNVSTENNHTTHEKLKKIVNPTRGQSKNFDRSILSYLHRLQSRWLEYSSELWEHEQQLCKTSTDQNSKDAFTDHQEE